MSTARHPRLGDRAGLRIDIMPLAILQYRTGIDEDISDDDARDGLSDSLRDSYVIYSSGETMRTRWRSRPLDTDLVATLTRVRPDHVRCVEVQIRGLQSSEAKSGRKGSFDLKDGPMRKHRLRVVSGGAEHRVPGSSEWRPAQLHMLAREYPEGHRVWAWLRSKGIERPSSASKRDPC